MTVREYLRPTSLPEALAVLALHGPELVVMAGGTVVMPLVNEGIALPERVMSLRHAGLDRVERRRDRLVIGAATPIARLLDDDAVPPLAEAAAATASATIRNLATVGGNLFTPPPGGDVAVALLALGARLSIAGPRGSREVGLEEFFTGFMTTSLAPDELVAEIHVPLDAPETSFVKLGRKHGNTPAVVTVAVALARHEGRVASARIALGAAGPHPIRATAAEASLLGLALGPDTIGAAAEAAAGECRPFDDGIASEWYRRRMVGVLVRRALEAIAR